MNAELQALRQNRAVVIAAIVAAIAVAVFALVGTAHLLGWIPRHVPAAASIAPAGPVASAPAVDLLPGESLVEPAPADGAAAARPHPMFPKYGSPAAPLPAPPASDANPPTGVPRNPYLATAPRPAPVPPAARPEAAPPAPREELPRAEIRPRGDRYASEEPRSRDEPRRRSSLCNNCAVVTAVSQYVDEWEVHLRFSDGSRRKILYTTPPPVSRGDRIVIENGRLFLDN